MVSRKYCWCETTLYLKLAFTCLQNKSEQRRTVTSIISLLYTSRDLLGVIESVKVQHRYKQLEDHRVVSWSRRATFLAPWDDSIRWWEECQRIRWLIGSCSLHQQWLLTLDISGREKSGPDHWLFRILNVFPWSNNKNVGSSISLKLLYCTFEGYWKPN